MTFVFYKKNSAARALIGKADRHTSVWLSLVVEPAFAGSFPNPLIAITRKAPQGCIFVIGAGNGNRTRIKSLGSSHSTIELYPRQWELT